jgi:hypothetical protein
MAERSLLASPPVLAVAGWIVPGSGYVLLGDVTRGLVIGVTIILLFLAGVLIAGIRVIDVPGYDNLGFREHLVVRSRNGQLVRERAFPGDADYPKSEWTLRTNPLGEVVEKPWFVAQVLAGPVALIGANWSLSAAQPAGPLSRVSAVPMSHARLSDIGSLYTAIAGMLNLLAIIDSASRAGRPATAARAPAGHPSPAGAA